MGSKHLNKPPFSGDGSSGCMYGSYRSGHRRSSVPNRAGSCGFLYYRGCKASFLFIWSAVCSTLANKKYYEFWSNTKNTNTGILDFNPTLVSLGILLFVNRRRTMPLPHGGPFPRKLCIMIHSCSPGHRRSSVPNRAGSCGFLYYRGCKASFLFIWSAVCSTLANKKYYEFWSNTKNTNTGILDFNPTLVSLGILLFVNRRRTMPLPHGGPFPRKLCIMIHSCSPCPWELGSLPYLE